MWILLGLLVVSVLGLAFVSWRLLGALREIARLRAGLVERRASLLGTTGRAVQVVATAAARVRDHGVSGFLLSSVDDLTGWVLEDRTDILRMADSDGTVTIFFSDIESSTEHNERIGDKAWVSLLAKHDAVLRSSVATYGGHIVKSQGDGFMIVFPDRASAVRAAVAVQRVIGAGRGRRLRRTPIRVRIGIHAGTVIAKNGDYFGRNVAMAARVAAQAGGGEILVSDTVREGLDDEFVLVESGTVELKGLDGEHQLWQVMV